MSDQSKQGPAPEPAAEEPEAAAPFRTVEPAVANVRPGSLTISDPRDRPKDEDPADPKCFSVIHDRPTIRLMKGARTGDSVSLKDKPRSYFHEGGACPCQDPDLPEPVPEAQRAKQLVRAARDEQLWVAPDLEKARATRRARERASEAREAKVRAEDARRRAQAARIAAKPTKEKK